MVIMAKIVSYCNAIEMGGNGRFSPPALPSNHVQQSLNKPAIRQLIRRRPEHTPMPRKRAKPVAPALGKS